MGRVGAISGKFSAVALSPCRLTIDQMVSHLRWEELLNRT
jgi:hypothetical protein